jgi:hypothetical protein
LEETKGLPEIETCFLATDETEKNRGTVRHVGFYPGLMEVIKAEDS